MSVAAAVRTSFPNGRPKAVTESLLRVRQRVDPARAFPDFVIIGGQRCGTSSLYKYLEDHPLIVPSLRKEIRYFNRHHAKGEGWYRAHFPSRWHRRWLRRRHGREPVTFEATPAYLLHPLAPVRASRLLPEARIVAILRNPVDRALSHFHHSVSRGWETLSFEEALEAEPARLADHAERLATDPTYYSNDYLRYSYAERGHYAEQLERWMAVYPIARILVLRSEDLFHEPVVTYHRLLEFLELPTWTPAHLANHSYRGAPPPERYGLSPDVRRQLVERFAPSNRRLEQLVGRSFGWDA